MCKPKNTSPKQYNPNSKSDVFVLHIVKPLLPEHPNVHMLTISTQSRCPAIQRDGPQLKRQLWSLSSVTRSTSETCLRVGSRGPCGGWWRPLSGPLDKS